MQVTALKRLQFSRLLLAGIFSFGLAACGGGEEEGGDMTVEGDSLAGDAATAPGAGMMGDGEIAAILAAADSSEILPSQAALQSAQNAQVKEYAQRMITDHGALSDSLRALAQANNIVPTPNPTSQQLQSQTQATVQSLQGQTGAAFDAAYMTAMVQSHQAALNMIDSQLLPAAQNPQLRTSLEQKVRPAVAMHLEQAQQVQSAVGAQ